MLIPKSGIALTAFPVLAIASASASAQTTAASASQASIVAAPPSPLDARIARVEASLLPKMGHVGMSAEMSLAERIRHYKVPGLSIAVIDRGRLAWARAYGIAAPGKRLTTETLLQAASISKPVFAAGALQLVHRGQIDLDRPANSFLRSWRVPDSELASGNAVTLRQLLSHTAGLSVHGFGGYAQGNPVPTLRQLLNGADPANSKPVRLTQLPGKAWRYSGGGTSVAQQLVEDVAGAPIANVLQASILTAADMTNSSFDQPMPAAKTSLAAFAHADDGVPVVGRWHTYPEQAAAGLWTTPTDLARFALWVIDGARASNGNNEQRFVASRLLEPQPGIQTDTATKMGLGLFLKGEGRSFHFSHGGSNKGFRAYLIGFPETGQGAAVMVNGDNGSPLIQEMLRAVAQEYAWPERLREVIVPVKITDAQMEIVSGIWRWGADKNDQLIIVRTRDGLTAQLPGEPPMRLVPTDYRTFVSVETGTRLRLDDDDLAITPPSGRAIAAKRQVATRN